VQGVHDEWGQWDRKTATVIGHVWNLSIWLCERTPSERRSVGAMRGKIRLEKRVIMLSVSLTNQMNTQIETDTDRQLGKHCIAANYNTHRCEQSVSGYESLSPHSPCSFIFLLCLMCAVETEDDWFRYTHTMCVRYRCWYQSIYTIPNW